MRSTLAWELQEGQARGDMQIRLGRGGSQVWTPSCAGINLECLGHRKVARGREGSGKRRMGRGLGQRGSGRRVLWGSGQLLCSS